MKKRLIFLLVGIPLFILYGCADPVLNTGQDTNILSEVKSRASVTRTFVFPPIQWDNFDNHDQKLAACQVPDSILSQISTEELVEVCMEYPLFIFHMASFIQNKKRCVFVNLNGDILHWQSKLNTAGFQEANSKQLIVP